MDFEPWTSVGLFARSSVSWESVGKYNPFGSIKGRPSDPNACSSELLSRDSSSTDELFCTDALKAVDSTLLSDDSRILTSCSASSLLSLAVDGFGHAWNARLGSGICIVALHYAKQLEQLLLELRSYSKRIRQRSFCWLTVFGQVRERD
jgi:hypothetical protein